jgi:ribonuclease HI
MELNSILKALQAIKNKEKFYVIITTDSMYSINCITTWSKAWIKNDRKTKDNKLVKNDFYIKEILATIEKFQDVKFIHVNGHAGHPENE